MWEKVLGLMPRPLGMACTGAIIHSPPRPPASDFKTWALTPLALAGGVKSSSHIAPTPPTLHPEPTASRTSASHQPVSIPMKNPGIQATRVHRTPTVCTAGGIVVTAADSTQPHGADIPGACPRPPLLSFKCGPEEPTHPDSWQQGRQQTAPGQGAPDI